MQHEIRATPYGFLAVEPSKASFAMAFVVRDFAWCYAVHIERGLGVLAKKALEKCLPLLWGLFGLGAVDRSFAEHLSHHAKFAHDWLRMVGKPAREFEAVLIKFTGLDFFLGGYGHDPEIQSPLRIALRLEAVTKFWLRTRRHLNEIIPASLQWRNIPNSAIWRFIPGSLQWLQRNLQEMQGQLCEVCVLNAVISRPCVAIQEPAVERLNELQIIEDVHHDEPAAVRDEELLPRQADEDWADQVQHAIQNCSEPSPDAEDVHVLRFGGDGTQEFRSLLLNGPQFAPCRRALADAGQPFEHDSGALMCLKPHQTDQINSRLEAAGHELHPFNVVITATFEYLLDELLAGMSCLKKPYEKTKSRFTIHTFKSSAVAQPNDGLVPEDTADDDILYSHALESFEPGVFVESRTFLCEAPLLRSASSVVQSTTGVVAESSSHHYARFRGVNPRRPMVNGDLARN